jgi:hypothetical protein
MINYFIFFFVAQITAINKYYFVQLFTTINCLLLQFSKLVAIFYEYESSIVHKTFQTPINIIIQLL